MSATQAVPPPPLSSKCGGVMGSQACSGSATWAGGES